MVIRLDKFDNKSCIGHVAASAAILLGHVPSAVGQMIDHAFLAQRACSEYTHEKHIHAAWGAHGGTTLAWVQSAAKSKAPAAGKGTVMLEQQQQH